METRGSSAAVGVLVMFSMIFACYLIYSTFSTPVTDVINAVDDADADNTIPDSILPGLTLAWEVWVMVLLGLTFVIVLAYSFRRESEHAYY